MMDAKLILVTLFALGTASVLQFVHRLYRNRRRFVGLPGPPHSFLWGHLKIMGDVVARFPPNMHPQSILTAIAVEYDLKGIFYLDLWPIADPQVILLEPELMDRVQVTGSFDQHKLSDQVVRPILGEDVVAVSNGPVWKKLHNAMAPAFQMSHIRTLTGLLTSETLIFRNTLRRLASSGEVFSMEHEASKVIFDVIAQVVFNFPLHAQTKGSRDLDDLRKTVDLTTQSLSMNPLVKLGVYFRKSAITKRLDASITAKIYERLAVLRTGKIVPSRNTFFSILDLMLRDTLMLSDTATSAEVAPLPAKELALLLSNVKGLLLGGHGTTVDTLCFVYMLLAKHPDVVQKLREEHDRVFSRDFSETLQLLVGSPSKLNELNYTSAVIQETLRLFPVGFGVKNAPRGATVNYNNRDWPLEDLVVVPNFHSLHYSAKYFPEPSRFLPERFLDDGVPRSWFRSFSRGPRACLGKNLAMEDMRIVLLLTVREFDFHCAGLKPNAKPRDPHTDLDTTYGDIAFQELGMEAHPRGGMMMKVTESGYGKS